MSWFMLIFFACFTVTSARRCSPILPSATTLCPTYNFTSLSPKNQNATLYHLRHFVPLHDAACSSLSKTLVCAAFLPFCHPVHPDVHVPPCCHLCLNVKSACLHLFRSANLPWPAKLNCTALPDPPQLCFGPAGSTPQPSTQPATVHFTRSTLQSSPSSPSVPSSPYLPSSPSSPSSPSLSTPPAPSPLAPWHIALIIGLPLCFLSLAGIFFWFKCLRRQPMPQPGPATTVFTPASPSPAPSPAPFPRHRPLPTPPLPPKLYSAYAVYYEPTSENVTIH